MFLTTNLLMALSFGTNTPEDSQRTRRTYRSTNARLEYFINMLFSILKSGVERLIKRGELKGSGPEAT